MMSCTGCKHSRLSTAAGLQQCPGIETVRVMRPSPVPVTWSRSFNPPLNQLKMQGVLHSAPKCSHTLGTQFRPGALKPTAADCTDSLSAHRSGLDGEEQDDARHHAEAELRPEGDDGQVAQAARGAGRYVRVAEPLAEGTAARRWARLLARLLLQWAWGNFATCGAGVKDSSRVAV